MKRLLFCITLLAVLAATPALAAESDTVLWGAYGGFSVGVMFLDTSDLNDYLDAWDVENFSTTLPALGLSGYAVLTDRFVVGWQGMITAQSKPGELADAQIIAGFTGLYFGYNVWRTSDWRLRPELGLGWSGAYLGLRNIVREAHDLHLPEGYDDVVMDRNEMHARLGFSAEWTPALKRNSNGLLGLALGLEVGVVLPMFEDNWSIRAVHGDDDDDDDKTIRGEKPDLQLLMPYCALAFRFGGGITEEN